MTVKAPCTLWQLTFFKKIKFRMCRMNSTKCHTFFFFWKDMFLSFWLWDVPVCHTENTARSQKPWEEAVNLASGGGTQSGLLAHTGKQRLLATGKGISLPLSKAVLYSLRNWRRLEFLVPHQQNKVVINHSAGCILKRSPGKSNWRSGSQYTSLPRPCLEKWGHLDFKITVSSHRLTQ